ncbi:MAG TPA: ABC transporter permease [Vicinamibacteria bacterium]|nr:ABC transporter permease [Vicinamibacteria bacterium]
MRPSLRALAAHKVRATLALASVAMGVAAVVVTSALGKGAEGEVQRGIDAMGTNLVVVRPAQVKRLVARKGLRGFATSLRIEDHQEIAALSFTREAAPAAEAGMRVKAGGGSMVASVTGTSAAFMALRNLRLRSGRFLGAEEDSSGSRVAVLGARVADTLFPGADPIGLAIRIRGVPFEVVGVLEPRGVLADGSDEDSKVLIPIRTALRRVFNSRWLTAIFVAVGDPERMAEAELAIRDLLRERHRLGTGKPDDFAIQNQAKLLAMQKRMVDSLSLLTTGLAGVSLLVGGAGILALMLLSVKERTGEIGLRMAVGARPRDILLQFLTEATLLALGGWLAGIAVGALAVAAAALITGWRVGVPAEAALATLATAMVTGLGFGALPARQAALLPPIKALAAR